MNLDDVLRDRLAVVKANGTAQEALRIVQKSIRLQIRIDPPLIERFSRMVKENFTAGSAPFRKACLQPSPLLRLMTAKSGRRAATTSLRKRSLRATTRRPSVRRRVLNGAPEEIRTPDPQIRRRACFIEGPSDSCKPALAAEYESQRVVSVLQTQTNRNAPARMAVRRGFLTLARRP